MKKYIATNAVKSVSKSMAINLGSGGVPKRKYNNEMRVWEQSPQVSKGFGSHSNVCKSQKWQDLFSEGVVT